MKTQFHCDKCGMDKTHDSDISTGYGTNDKGEKHCFDCCAIDDREWMDLKGKTTLYLTVNNGRSYVSNWPGTLKYPCRNVTNGRHNIAGTRYDAWFKDHAGFPWWGVQYGEMTQIIHCKRIKVWPF